MEFIKKKVWALNPNLGLSWLEIFLSTMGGKIRYGKFAFGCHGPQIQCVRILPRILHEAVARGCKSSKKGENIEA